MGGKSRGLGRTKTSGSITLKAHSHAGGAPLGKHQQEILKRMGALPIGDDLQQVFKIHMAIRVVVAGAVAAAFLGDGVPAVVDKRAEDLTD